MFGSVAGLASRALAAGLAPKDALLKKPISTMVADVELEVKSPNSNFSQSFRYRQTVSMPDKLRIELLDMPGSIEFEGKKVTVKAGQNYEKTVKMKEDLGPLLAMLGRNPFSETSTILGNSDRFTKKGKKFGQDVYTLSLAGAQEQSGAMEVDVDTKVGVVKELRM